MAVGDKVKTTRDIRSFDKNLKIRADAIPSGTLGRIIQQNNDEGWIAVKFENGINGTFGDHLAHGLDSVTIIDETPSPDIMRRNTALEPDGEAVVS